MAKSVPESYKELRALCDDLSVNLGEIDTSKITNMSKLFWGSRRTNEEYSGIESWAVSHVEDLRGMFQDSNCNGDISNWDVSKVKSMNYMFSNSEFNGDLSK